MTARADAAPRRGLVLAFAALAAVLFALGAWAGWRRATPPSLDAWDVELRAAATESGVPLDLLRALVAAESGGRPRAESPKGARGLLQLMPATAREQAARMDIDLAEAGGLDDPVVNLRLGAGYLARMLRRYDGEPAFAVAAYNAGPTPVDRWRRRAPDASPLDVVLREGYEETRRHVVKVLAWRRHYGAD